MSANVPPAPDLFPSQSLFFPNIRPMRSRFAVLGWQPMQFRTIRGGRVGGEVRRIFSFHFPDLGFRVEKEMRLPRWRSTSQGPDAAEDSDRRAPRLAHHVSALVHVPS